MSVTVGNKVYRTLEDEMTVSGRKVNEITVNGDVVYPEDLSHPYKAIIKASNAGVVTHEMFHWFRQNGMNTEDFVEFSARYSGDITVTIESDLPFGTFRRHDDTIAVEYSVAEWSSSVIATEYLSTVYGTKMRTGSVRYRVQPYHQPFFENLWNAGYSRRATFRDISGYLYINTFADLIIHAYGTANCEYTFHDDDIYSSPDGEYARDSDTKQWQEAFDASCGDFDVKVRRRLGSVVRDGYLPIDEDETIGFGSYFGWGSVSGQTSASEARYRDAIFPQSESDDGFLYFPLTHLAVASMAVDDGRSHEFFVKPKICIFDGLRYTTSRLI